MRTDTCCLWAGAASSLFVHIFLFVLFESARDRPDESTDQQVHALRALCGVGIVLVTAPYIGWELEYGSAFSYFWPLHGIARISGYTWRVGIFLKAALVAHIVAFIAAFCAEGRPLKSSDGSDTELLGLRLLSRLSYVDALLVPVCSAFPVAAMLIYTGVPNISHAVKKPL